MALADYLRKECICLNLDKPARDDAIRALLERLVAAGTLPARLLEKAVAAIIEREKLGSTAIGRGVAVPHARVKDMDDILVAFGYCAEGVEFKALDGEPVHMVFLILAPAGKADEYLNVMERVTRLVQDDDFRRFVRRVKTSEEFLDLIREMDK